MNPLGPTTYTLVKLEQEHRLARLEHRRRQLEESPTPRVHRTERTVPQVTLTRRIAVATASAAGLLALVAGAALAFPG